MISQCHLLTEQIECPILLMHYCPRQQVVVALLPLPLEWTKLLEPSSMAQPVSDKKRQFYVNLMLDHHYQLVYILEGRKE